MRATRKSRRGRRSLAKMTKRVKSRRTRSSKRRSKRNTRGKRGGWSQKEFAERESNKAKLECDKANFEKELTFHNKYLKLLEDKIPLEDVIIKDKNDIINKIRVNDLNLKILIDKQNILQAEIARGELSDEAKAKAKAQAKAQAQAQDQAKANAAYDAQVKAHAQAQAQAWGSSSSS